MTKKRAPIEQLREAGRAAHKMLIDRGIIAKESVIDQILKDSKSPKLPGIPAYLPHEWTIIASQRIMRDLVVMWKAKTESVALEDYKIKKKKGYVAKIIVDTKKREDITEFWKFCLVSLKDQEKVFAKEKKAMPAKLAEMEKKVGGVPVLKDVFSPMRKEENLNAIQHFLVDSFAVAIVVKKHDTVTDYLNWFLDWTQDLHFLWVKPAKRKDIKRI